MRPTLFVHWRKLWWDQSRILGQMIGDRFIRNRGRVVLDKATWKQIERVARVRKRLDVESEVKDKSWLLELLRVLKDDQ